MRNQYKIILLVAVFSVVTIAIAYAALSQTLTITTNNVIQTAYSWNPRITTCSKTLDIGTSATGRTCGTATVASGNLAVTVSDTTLSKPEDACVYKCTISTAKVNSSDPTPLPAKINAIVPTDPTSNSCTKTNASSSASASMVCGNITYGIYASATNSSGTTITTSNLTTGTSIASAGTKDFYLVIRYSGTSVNSSAVTQAGGKFTFTLIPN